MISTVSPALLAQQLRIVVEGIKLGTINLALDRDANVYRLRPAEGSAYAQDDYFCDLLAVARKRVRQLVCLEALTIQHVVAARLLRSPMNQLELAVDFLSRPVVLG